VARYDLPNAAPAPLRIVQQFVNTVDLEHGREWLGSPAALESWCAEHGLALEAPVSEPELRRALDVREALRALARANNGLPLDPGAIATLNHALVAARVEPALDSSGRPALEPHGRGLDAALGGILATYLEATLDGSWGRLKSCRQCRWLFYDNSSNRSARWCSMELCGNRRKTRAYRSRRRAERSVEER
jgi:predicted RNA-binding Zn ribbon-like protein